ncbi:MAG: lysostaphin resistance A-like protein [Gaiellaceae bacterium]
MRQYSLAQIAAVWAAAALPMGLLAWVVAPWLEGSLGGEAPLAKALLLCLTAGLIWQFALVLILVGREQGTLRWSRLREALWLRAPRDARTGRMGGRLWLWALVFVVAYGLLEALPVRLSGPSDRDFGPFLGTDAGEALFRGAWGWFGVVVVLAVFNTVLGEELLFRGLLLPRMQGAFGRGDWLANAILFGLYHLHIPWAIPSAVAGGLLFSYPSRRFESSLMGILVHSAQSVVVLVVVLVLVLD